MSNGTIDWTLGLKVKITTLLDNTITGTIYAFCHTTNTITLIEDIVQNEPGRRNLNDGSPSRSLKGSEKPPTPNYRIIKTSFVKEATVLSKPKKTPGHPSATSTYKDVFAKAEPSIGKVNIAKLVAKADKAVQAELKRRARIGVGVTKEAQALFDLLSKTFPTVWHGKSIYAMDEVTIAPPYTLEDCKAESSNSKSLAYVQRVLQGAREKLSIGNTQIKGG